MTISSPALIVIGGFAGTGKTTMSKRLATELRLPRLGADTIGRTIRESRGNLGNGANAYWVAYDVLFRLCEEFLCSGVSTIVDITLGWDFQWHQLDAIKGRLPEIQLVPIILRCSRDVCLERIHQRYWAAPGVYDPPELFATDPKLLAVWNFLERLNRPDVHVVDAARTLDVVYGDFKQYVLERVRIAG